MVELVLIVVLTNQFVITLNSVIDYALISTTLFRSVIDFNVLTFDPMLSVIHNPICLHLCTNIVNNSNLTDVQTLIMN